MSLQWRLMHHEIASSRVLLYDISIQQESSIMGGAFVWFLNLSIFVLRLLWEGLQPHFPLG